MSDMIKLFADQLNLRYEDILNEQAFWNYLADELGYLFPANALTTLLKNRICSFTFTLFKDRKDGSYRTLGSSINIEAIRSAKHKKPIIIYNLLKAFGARGVAQNVFRMLQIPASPLGEMNHLMVFVRCWPNVYNIDLEENKKCPSLYFRNGEYLPFCYANIRDTFRQRPQK